MSSGASLSVRTLAAALFAAAALPACAGATGNDWVREPEAGLHAGTGPLAPSSPGAFDVVARVATSPSPSARPRLRRTVSLGETSAEAARTGSAAPDAASERLATVVVINQYFDVGGAGFGSVLSVDGRTGRDFAGPAPRRGAARAGSTPALGGDWPAPPSYGPPFPYRTAPASPWQPAR